MSGWPANGEAPPPAPPPEAVAEVEAGRGGGGSSLEEGLGSGGDRRSLAGRSLAKVSDSQRDLRAEAEEDEGFDGCLRFFMAKLGLGMMEKGDEDDDGGAQWMVSLRKGYFWPFNLIFFFLMFCSLVPQIML